MIPIQLGHSIHEDAVVMPATATSVRPWRGYGGVYDAAGAFDPSSALVRDYGVIVDQPPRCPRAVGQVIDQECIFAGYLIAGHFGHFLLESCARLWFAQARPDLPLLWSHGQALAPFNKAVLQILGIRNPSIFMTAPARVARLHVPSVGYRIRDGASEAHMRFMGAWDEAPMNATAAGRKVWLSRAALPRSHGRVVQEPEIVQTLSEHGWIVFEPEKHSLVEQLRMLAGAGHVAGFMGSAFHALVLLKRFSGKVTLFSRGMANPNFVTIAKARQFDQSIIDLPLLAIGGSGSRTEWSLADMSLVHDRLCTA